MSAQVVVKTSFGRLAGVREDGLSVFRGVPFAKPPVGPLRFRPPEPPESWTGVRDALRFGASAPQPKMEVELLPGMDVGRQDSAERAAWDGIL